MADATHMPVRILLVLEENEEREAEYAVFSGLISKAERDLLELFQLGEFWSPRNVEVNAYLALISWFSDKVEVDRWRPGNPVDEGHLAHVVPEEMKRMLKAMQRRYIADTYHYVIMDTGCDGYCAEETMLTYIRYLQTVSNRAPQSLHAVQRDFVARLPELLGLEERQRDANPIRDLIIRSSSQDKD
jgi:hypothetical protein